MNLQALKAILLCGEDSRHQFKSSIPHVDTLTAELVALANSGGGQIFIGVADDGSICGLDAAAVRRVNQLLSNAASHNVRPPVHPLTSNVQTEQGLVMVVTMPNGLNKPYMDLQGRVWVKSGADKRHVTAREEMQRMFQSAGMIRADVVPVSGTTVEDVDEKFFRSYVQRRFGEGFAQGQSIDQQLHSLSLASGNALNLSGLLLFGKTPQRWLPVCMVKAVAFPGTSLGDKYYQDSEDIYGTLPEQYQRSFAFIKRNLHHIQKGRGFNTLGELEIPPVALEELLVNALVHRDYFTSASIRLLVFADRVEIISPGHLPDNLNPEALRQGKTNRRNPTLTEHASQMLPYRGLGSGITRALQDWPHIELVDDRAGNEFKAVIARPARPAQTITGQVADQVTGQVADQVGEEVMALLRAMQGEMTRAQLMQAVGLAGTANFRKLYLMPALHQGLVEMTIPDKPQSRLQRYRLTAAGLRLKARGAGA